MPHSETPKKQTEGNCVNTVMYLCGRNGDPTVATVQSNSSDTDVARTSDSMNMFEFTTEEEAELQILEGPVQRSKFEQTHLREDPVKVVG